MMVNDLKIREGITSDHKTVIQIAKSLDDWFNDDGIKYIEQDSQEEELQQEVWKVWKTLYKSEERKPRKW